MADKDKNDKKSPKTDKRDQKISELTADLQRTRADFENYRKRVEAEKQQCRADGRNSAVLSLLPVIDSIERAITHVPSDLADHSWVQGIISMTKQLDKTLAGLDLSRIDSKPGTAFNPDQHDAIQVDEDAEGEAEVIDVELQAGYMLAGQVIRPALVKVTRK